MTLFDEEKKMCRILTHFTINSNLTNSASTKHTNLWITNTFNT